MQLSERLAIAIGRAEYRALTAIAESLAGLRREATVIDGIHVPYFVGQPVQGGAGAAEVPMLFVHGFASNKESWLLLLVRLQKRYCVIVPDLPGFGEAGTIPRRSASAAAQARALAKLLEELRIPLVHVVGSSMGGGIALRFAAEFPRRTRALTLIGSVAPIVEKSEVDWALERGQNPLLTASRADFDRVLRLSAEKLPPTSPALRAYLGAERHARREPLSQLFDGWIAPAREEGIPENLESIAAPTLVVHGDRDRIVHPANAAALATRLPNARLEALRGIGHAPQLEAPKQTARLIEQFARSVARSLK